MFDRETERSGFGPMRMWIHRRVEVVGRLGGSPPAECLAFAGVRVDSQVLTLFCTYGRVFEFR